MNEPSRMDMGSRTMSGRATVGLLWVIFGILVMLGMGFLAWNSYQQIEGLQKGGTDSKGAKIEGLESARQKSDAQRKANRYLTATVHHASGILGDAATVGSVRSPSVYDFAAFLRSIENIAVDSGLYEDSDKVRAIVDELREARETMVSTYESALKRSEEKAVEGEEASEKEVFPARAALQGFTLDSAKLANLFQGEDSAPTSYLTGLMKAFQMQYEARKQRYEDLRSELFAETFGGKPGLMQKERTATQEFVDAVDTIRARTHDLIHQDSETKIVDSLQTIKTAAQRIQSALQAEDRSTSEIYGEMTGRDGWVTSFSQLREKEKELQRYKKREEAVKAALGKVVESTFGTDLQADGRILRVAPNASDVYIDLDVMDHIDVGLVFEVYGLSRAALARGDVNGPRTLRGEVEVVEVGAKGRPSRARIILARGPMQAGDILVNREFNPAYKPRVALAGIFRGYLTREQLADTLREYNFEVQEKVDYDTDFIIRGDGGLPEEPMLDGIPISELGIKTVPMRRVLRMLQLPLPN